MRLVLLVAISLLAGNAICSAICVVEFAPVTHAGGCPKHQTPQKQALHCNPQQVEAAYSVVVPVPQTSEKFQVQYLQDPHSFETAGDPAPERPPGPAPFVLRI
jgi:hypothetical protein